MAQSQLRTSLINNQRRLFTLENTYRNRNITFCLKIKLDKKISSFLVVTGGGSELHDLRYLEQV